MLNITLLGQFNLRWEDAPLELSSRPAQTLLAYLLLNRTITHRREHLAGMLWPDYPESSARQSLRNALWQLRQAVGHDYLLVDKTSLAFNTTAPHSLDVTVLESDFETGELDQLIQIVSVYEGDLLPGFYEDWILLERERLRALFERRVQALLDGLGTAGHWQAVQTWAEHWIALGHIPEPAYRALMRAHAALGDQAGMVTAYRRCVQALKEELGVSPSVETQALYERLSKGDRIPAQPRKPAPLTETRREDGAAQATTAQSTLPIYATPFVGRQAELAEINRLLQQEPDCRLLALVGPGGIGKTRLALEVARGIQMPHGAWFVPLASLGSRASLFSAIADAVQLQLDGADDPGEQVIAYLRQREILLILDNFEHLLSPFYFPDEAERQELATSLTRLLEHTSGLKLLVTSRERLNLSAEWVYSVEGLQIPPRPEGVTERTVESFGAVQLFLQRARQLKRDFGREDEELACASRICRLASGMPLAIELAAAWVSLLSCREIYEEIERNLNFLRTSLRDYPERHRDMRAVFDTSWNMLTESERRLFRRLSVFRGGFIRAAAEAVGGEIGWEENELTLSPEGTLQLMQREPRLLDALAGLADKSFVRYAPGERYEIHDLMRQYGAAKLLERPEEEQRTRDDHARYYLSFLMHQEAPLTGPQQRTGVANVALELQNINAAWRWAVAKDKLTDINRALGSYFNFCLTRSRLQEGSEAFAHLVGYLRQAEHLREHPQYSVVLARAFIRHAALCYLLGQYEEARRSAEEALAIGLGENYRSDVAFAQIVLGVVAGWQGDKELAEAWLCKSLAISREIDDKENMADALHELAQLHSSFGDYPEAKRLALESLEVSRAYGRLDWIAQALVILGWAVVCLGEYSDAEAHNREALAIFESLGNRHGTANALDGLGWVAWCRENFDEAASYYEKSLAIIRELGHRRILANTLCDLAILANEQEDFARAETISQEGLRLADELESTVYKVPYLCCLGRAVRGTGNYAESRRYLSEALHLAYNTRLWPPLNLILYEFAGLLLAECDVIDSGDRTSLQRKAKALELLTFVIVQPATWQAIRERATRLQARLMAELPEDVATTAVAHGKDKTMDEAVEDLLQPEKAS